MALISALQPGSSVSVFGLISLPLVFAPFESLVLTSILIPQASFIGHLAGIIAGYMVASGTFQVRRAEQNACWHFTARFGHLNVHQMLLIFVVASVQGFSNMWAAISFFWFSVGTLISLKQTSPFPLQFFEVERLVTADERRALEGASQV